MDLKHLLDIRRQSTAKIPQEASPATADKPMMKATFPTVRKNTMPAVKMRNTPCAVPVACLPDKAAAKARERLSFVLTVRSFAAAQQLPIRDAVELVRSRYMENYPLLSEGGKHGVCTLTISSYRNWSPCVPSHYTERDEAQTLQKLADGYRRGRQETSGPASFYKYLCAAWLSSHRLSMAKAYDIAVKRLRKDDDALVPPTFYQAKYYLGHIDKAIVSIGRDGGTAFKNLFIDYIDRDWSAILPGDMVVGDSRTFDTRCRIWEDKGKRWIAVRPTICALMDAASNYFAAWTITPDAIDSNSIANTLGLYCSLYGVPPRHAYFDNGKDYTAKGFSTPLEVAGRQYSIFQALGITMTNSIAYNARAKTIERQFANMMRDFDKTMPDYLGSKPEQRTMDADWYDKHPEGLPSLQQFIEAFSSWLQDFHARPQKSIILENRAPQDVWDARPQVTPISPDSLARAFQRPIGLRKVFRGPSVQLSGRRFIGDDLAVGSIVLVKLDPVAEDKIHCYSPDGAFICTATQRERIPALAESQEDKDLLAELIERQRSQMKKAITALRDMTGGLHLLSPYEILNAEPNSEIVRLGTVVSVKGKEHRYEKLALANQNITPTDKKAQNRDEEEIDTELQKLINESRHDFTENKTDLDIFAALAKETPQEEELPNVSIRNSSGEKDEDTTAIHIRAALAAQN